MIIIKKSLLVRQGKRVDGEYRPGQRGAADADWRSCQTQIGAARTVDFWALLSMIDDIPKVKVP